MKFWIVNYHHVHGNDAWPRFQESEPVLSEEADKLDDFESDREFLSVHGPFYVPGTEEESTTPSYFLEEVDGEPRLTQRSQWEEM